MGSMRRHVQVDTETAEASHRPTGVKVVWRRSRRQVNGRREGDRETLLHTHRTAQITNHTKVLDDLGEISGETGEQRAYWDVSENDYTGLDIKALKRWRTLLELQVKYVRPGRLSSVF